MNKFEGEPSYVLDLWKYLRNIRDSGDLVDPLAARILKSDNSCAKAGEIARILCPSVLKGFIWVDSKDVRMGRIMVRVSDIELI